MSATCARHSIGPSRCLCDDEAVRLDRALVGLSDAALGRDRPAAFRQRRHRGRDVAHAARLLARAQDCERQLGRDRAREQRWGPRPIDIDILAYDDRGARPMPDLTLPHPRLFERAFVLVPLAEIAPDA